MASVIQKWRDRFAATSDNESGAETIEIIVFLAIFVIGMIAVWALMRNAAESKGNQITDCLNGGTVDGVEC